jgi:hypothetical protein
MTQPSPPKSEGPPTKEGLRSCSCRCFFRCLPDAILLEQAWQYKSVQRGNHYREAR